MSSIPSTRYLIFGAGRQGTAAAYDLAMHGEAAAITLADRGLDVAQQSAERVNSLAGREVVSALALDVTNHASLVEALRDADVALSAVPYFFNVAITEAALEAGTHLCDMGGNTDVVREQLTYDAQAQAAGISILPDCGMGPGLVNVLAVYAIELLDEIDEVTIYDGGLPQHPEPPWNYQLTFHINGLTNEYDGDVWLLRGGEIISVDALSECQMVTLPGLGTLETFIAAGGSTAPWTFHGLLDRFETRILRYPGHYAWFKGFQTLGLFGLEPIDVDGQQVVPRDVYHALLAPQIVVPGIRDVALMRALGRGTKDGQPTTVTIDVQDRFDEATGFTAMERLTGWHCAIMMAMQARGQVGSGARALEARLLDGEPTAAAVMDAVQARGINVAVTFS
jgi:lysine 6-dehydrogenase